MAREGAALWRMQRRKGCACDSIHKRMPGGPGAGFTDVCGGAPSPLQTLQCRADTPSGNSLHVRNLREELVQTLARLLKAVSQPLEKELPCVVGSWGG